MGDINNEASALTFRHVEVPLASVPEPVAINIEPIEEPVRVENEYAWDKFATVYSEPNCLGQSWNVLRLANGDSRNIFYEELLDTSVGDNSISSMMIPAGYELELW